MRTGGRLMISKVPEACQYRPVEPAHECPGLFFFQFTDSVLLRDESKTHFEPLIGEAPVYVRAQVRLLHHVAPFHFT